MAKDSRESILEGIRNALMDADKGRAGQYPSPIDLQTGENISPDDMSARFIQELENLNAFGHVAGNENELIAHIKGIFNDNNARSCVISDTNLLNKYNIYSHLRDHGVQAYGVDTGGEHVSTVDIGITDADYAISESGTTVLFCNFRNPRSFSLLPAIHIAIIKRSSILNSLYDLFERISGLYTDTDIRDVTDCMTFITGPSRTADIELILTLGVHGPKGVYVIVLANE